MMQETTKAAFVQVPDFLLLFLAKHYQLSREKSGFLSDGWERYHFCARGEDLPYRIAIQGRQSYHRGELYSTHAKRTFLEQVMLDFNNDRWIEMPDHLPTFIMEREPGRYTLEQGQEPKTFNYSDGVMVVMKLTFNPITSKSVWTVRQFVIRKLISEILA